MNNMSGGLGSSGATKAFEKAAKTGARQPQNGNRPAPFSLRLTFEERVALEAQAGSMALGAYIRSKLLDDGGDKRRSYRKPVRDEQALARLLGELGNAKLANNLNQLAKAANTGSLPVTPETAQAIRAACADVKRMRDSLMVALGLEPGSRP